MQTSTNQFGDSFADTDIPTLGISLHLGHNIIIDKKSGSHGNNDAILLHMMLICKVQHQSRKQAARRMLALLAAGTGMRFCQGFESHCGSAGRPILPGLFESWLQYRRNRSRWQRTNRVRMNYDQGLAASLSKVESVIQN
jgi:hypothetical protein